MTKKEYKKRLSDHDWFYFNSHDTRIAVKGAINENDLKSWWEKDKSFERMYKKHFKKVYGITFPEAKKK